MRNYLLTLLLLLAPLPALAAPENPPAQGALAPIRQVTIEMMVVHATDSSDGIDPRLSGLSSSFRYFKYKGYRLLSTQSKSVNIDGSASFPVEGDRTVRVTLISADPDRARVRVEMTNRDGKLLDTTVSINRNGTFIVAGPRYQDGILMLPLRASY